MTRFARPGELSCVAAGRSRTALFLPESKIFFHGELGFRLPQVQIFGSRCVRLFLLSAGDSGDPDRRGSCAAERGGAGAGGGAGGENVVDEENVAALDHLGPRDKESPADVRTALMRSEAGLAFGGALPHQQRSGQFDAHLGATAAEGGDQAAREPLGLVEPAAAAFSAMEGNGNGEQFGGQIREGEDWFREQASEAFRQRLHTVVFKEMEQGAELAVIDAVCDGLGEVRRHGLAGTAHRSGAAGRIPRKSLATASAKGTCLSGEIVPAGRTDGQESETSKRQAADAAIGGKKYGGETVQDGPAGTSEHANHRTPGRYIGWRNFGRQGKTLTEDTPRFGGPGEGASLGAVYGGSMKAATSGRAQAVAKVL
jgi:hypothetical protein